MHLDHELIRTVCIVSGAIGGGITGLIALWKLIIFLGKMLARFESMDGTLKKMSEFQESHGSLMVDTRVRVTGLEKWRDEVIEDSRAGSGIFSNQKGKKSNG